MKCFNMDVYTCRYGLMIFQDCYSFIYSWCCHQSPLSIQTVGSVFTTQFHIGLVKSLARPFIGSSKKVLGSIRLFYCLAIDNYLSRCFLVLVLTNESIFFSNMFNKYTLLSNINLSTCLMSDVRSLFIFFFSI